MNLKQILKVHSNLTIPDLQELQREYDRRFVDCKFTGFDKVRHTYAHMGKLMGRMAEYVEAMEEGKEISQEDMRGKVIPDLMVYAAWLANEFGVDMEEAYLKRFVGNLSRLYADEIPSEELKDLENHVDEKFGSKR